MWKSRIKMIIKYLFILVCIAVFGIFIYPGIYRFDKLDQKYPVMINRITGETKVLYTDTWETVGNADKQLSKFEEYKQEIISAMDAQNEQIKESILVSIKDELNQAKDEVIEKATTSVEEGHKYDFLREASSNKQSADSFFEGVRDRDDSQVVVVTPDPTKAPEKEYLGEKFGEGDSKETVKSIMGVPDSKNGSGLYETWSYGLSYITFKDGIVDSWNNMGKNLYLK